MKKVLSLLLSSILLFITSSTVSASLLTINKDGGITWKVLSEQDSVVLEIPTHSYIEVKKTTDDQVGKPSLVSLARVDGKVSLVVSSKDEERELDVSSAQGELVEIEERAETQKLSIGLNGNEFTLKQKGATARTRFPITIDTKKAKLLVTTESGDHFLAVLPHQAVQTILRTKLLSQISREKIEIIEEERELQYLVFGEKVIDIYGLFQYSIPVSTKLSASTGEIMSIEAPIWYKAVAFLLT